MTIRLFDSMTREKRTFIPQDPKRVTMYAGQPFIIGRISAIFAR